MAKKIGAFVLPLRGVLFKTKKKQQQANKKQQQHFFEKKNIWKAKHIMKVPL
jgi:hypothetical protein